MHPEVSTDMSDPQASSAEVPLLDFIRARYAEQDSILDEILSVESRAKLREAERALEARILGT
jgi:hypothetical protein